MEMTCTKCKFNWYWHEEERYFMDEKGETCNEIFFDIYPDGIYINQCHCGHVLGVYSMRHAEFYKEEGSWSYVED